MSIMRTYHTNITGAYVAECPTCYRTLVYWDADDLNDDGQLECSCEDGELGVCDICEEPYVLGSDDHNTETGNHRDCEATR